MIQVGSFLKVVDKTGVTLVSCIKVLNSLKSRLAYIGDVMMVSVKRINPKKFKNVKLLKRKRFFKGTIHRALLVRGGFPFKRTSSVLIKFNENSVVLVNKKKVPISKLVYGPIIRELAMRIPSLGCVSRFMI